MRRSILIWAVFGTLFAAISSKTIDPGKHETPDATTGARLFTILPDLSIRDKPEAKLNSKRSLLVLLPEESQGIVRKSQKTKRCDGSICKENVGKNNEYIVGQRPPQLGLVSSRNPNAMNEEENADRNVAFVKAIRDKLKSRDYNVGAVRKTSQKTSIIDDDKYVCYCRMKNPPIVRKDAVRDKSQLLGRKYKPEKKEDNRKVVLQRQRPIHANLPQQSKIERVPVFPNAFGSNGDKPDSIVGQQAPTTQGHDFNEDQQTIGQRLCTPNVAEILSQPKQSAENNDLRDYSAQEKHREDPSVPDYNLQSVHLDLSQHTTPWISPNVDDEIEKNEMTQDGSRNDPEIINAASPANFPETGRTLDYSEIKEVTSAYFTSKAYSDETDETNGYVGHTGLSGFDQFSITGDGATSTAEDRANAASVQSRSNTPTEASTNREEVAPKMNDTPESDDASQNDGEIILGKNNPYWNKAESANDRLNADVGTNVENENHNGSSFPPIESNVQERIDDTDTTSNEEFSLKNVESKEEIDDTNGGNEETGPVSDSSMEQTTYSGDPGDDYRTIDVNSVNAANENVAATIQSGNEYDSAVESTLEPFGGVDAGRIKDPSEQTLPFCDNTLLQKSITAVINNFATNDDSSETVGSTGGDLLEEIVRIPNLKGILAVPMIERTILDKAKNLLAKQTGMARSNFDNDQATSIIRNNLRSMMAAATVSDTELPPMTVQERRLKNGKWITNLVTLEPTSNEGQPMSSLDKLRATVRNVLQDPAIGLEAARQPAVRNMIVQSVRNTFEPTDSNGVLDEPVVQSILENELSLMEMEDTEITTVESTGESETIDESNFDMEKLLQIAKNEAGMDSSTSSIETVTTMSVSPELPEGTAENFVGATKILESTEYLELSSVETTSYPEENETLETEGKYRESESTVSNLEGSPEVFTPSNIVGVTSNDQNEFSTSEMPESTEGTMVMEVNSNDDGSPEHDYTYLGKISMKKNDYDDVQSLRNSELYYVGDGVKLPLEITKLNDGSYALSISRKVCEHLLNKECPCCVPTKGNVVRTVRRNPETIESIGRKRISKRESTKSILSNERGDRNSADDSLQILSMPVETFAKRYNLSLNLEKVQAPWNFNANEKIDGYANGREKNVRDDEDNADTDLLRNLLSVHAVSENDKLETPTADIDTMNHMYQLRKQRRFDKYRYQRNIDETVNKRVEIVTSVLNWLRDMILSSTPDT
ncbi:uncharacterized protein LOC122405175 [Colletes gigas]|uniref:uncharacterized protein LOC122405175 n=1 Tax=Colletes gigas TaxID=935657 RepID=UPI001C9AB7AE|nr:uncharacterized protein LOC122405175 [Colletes gigas]